MSEQNSETGMDDWGAAMAEQAAVEAKPPAPAAGAKTARNGNGGTPVAPQPLHDEAGLAGEDVNLEVVLDIPVTLAMEIGRAKLPIRNLLQLNQGSVVELERLVGEPMDVLVNGTLIAHGEVVVINEKYGIRLTDVISPAERVRKLR
ncbi:flagellar motor switch protein FliN [Wenzhouxiangella sp. XN24]|uniref:flagellar motor switch protein FliN n=1 Tax=Wenzhouxiangella sp. XN24 TaxID=2713569 RepID=UPI0013EA85EB|nr:flagellar motor switch protein FliN [Wenzhouxiangella sp. XN24]NGX16237.1 flagellar motor switch protein FliN [Wenzhouxiangella sp. XN24]